MSLLRPLGMAVVFAIAAAAAGDAAGQGFYHRTVQKNPLTGRQEIIDLQRPRWTGEGKGGFMFDPAIGSMQVAAVGRNRFTGRLEYYNRYMNPWTGSQYSTATQFNPYSGRYETLHQIQPPPEQKEQASPAEAVVVTPKAKVKQRVRVIEINLDANAPPLAIAPGATAPDLFPGGVQPPQEQASSKTIEWEKDHSTSTNDDSKPKESL
jgi:hypothetical protein